jgi:pyruvate dehydrogenase E2 component (dihydrolipoamide acetyltransferase)
MADVSMPRLSDSMEEGTILKWLKSDGDEVRRGDELVEIETDKANMTYEADQDGVLSITAAEGDTLAVGEKIASIGEGSADGGQPDEKQPEAEQQDEPPSEEQADEQPAAEQHEEEPAEEQSAEQPAAEQPAAEEPPDAQPEQQDEERRSEEEPAAEQPSEEPAAESEAEQAEVEGEASGEENGRIKASPVARRMARELGLELAAVEGTGPGGRIVKADVEAASGSPRQETAEAEAPVEEAAPAEKEPERAPAPAARSGDAQTGRGESETRELTRLQQTVARRMAESKATAPEFVLQAEVDMEEAVELRKQLKAAAGGRPAPSFNDFIVKAAALALTEFPRANASYRDGKFELYSRVNVGVAVAGQDALVVPTVFDADRKSLGEIARETRSLAEKVRDGKITPPELSAGTFTVSNLGMYGMDRIVPVINPPQAAILGVGAMSPKPVVVDGEVTVRARMALTLVCDHRILYGADAAEFLSRIRERLENPLSLAL